MNVLNAACTKPREGGPSFSLRNRLVRVVWNLVWIFGYHSPTPFFSWRRFLLRMFGAQLASTAKVYPHVRVWYPANLEMEDYACLARGVNCYSMAVIRLRRYALVSQGAHLCAGTHDIDSIDFQLKVRPISIGENAWVAADAFVGPGAVLEDGAVLGARGVGFGRLERLTVYAGNPARALRQRRLPNV